MFASPVFSDLTRSATGEVDTNCTEYTIYETEYNPSLRPVLIFNLAKEISLFINAMYLPCSELFDYFNPLFLSEKNNDFRFYDSNKGEFVTSFKCLVLTSAKLRLFYPQLENEQIFYSYGYTIDYKNKHAFVATQGVSMFDLLIKFNPMQPAIQLNPQLSFQADSTFAALMGLNPNTNPTLQQALAFVNQNLIPYSSQNTEIDLDDEQLDDNSDENIPE